jgi:hypothetical protein
VIVNGRFVRHVSIDSLIAAGRRQGEERQQAEQNTRSINSHYLPFELKMI